MILVVCLASFLAGALSVRVAQLWRIDRLLRRRYQPASYRDTNLHHLEEEL